MSEEKTIERQSMDTENQPLEDMEVELPKRVFPPGYEPQVTHINNNCKMSTLKTLKELLPSEYKKLKTESVFAPIIAIYENELNYSARLIHSFVCRQLVTYKEIDAIMYIFWEKTNLQRWDQRAVDFLNTLFTAHVTTSYNRYLKDKRGYKVDHILLSYGMGSRPSHGRTNQVWGLDVERLYIPYNVNGNHWISMFVNITRRTIEVFDCGGKKNKRSIEPFAFAIPRIVKAVHPAADVKQMTVTPYTITHAPMKSRLNTSACDYGMYALKFIECHLLGLDMSLVDDEVIRWCRQKITFDLWKAANDPILTERMATYKPEESDSTVLDID